MKTPPTMLSTRTSSATLEPKANTIPDMTRSGEQGNQCKPCFTKEEDLGNFVSEPSVSSPKGITALPENIADDEVKVVKIKKRRKKRSETALELLEKEAKNIIGRRTRTCTAYARRAKVHYPTLEEMQAQSFADFIRGTVMGVRDVRRQRRKHLEAKTLQAQDTHVEGISPLEIISSAALHLDNEGGSKLTNNTKPEESTPYSDIDDASVEDPFKQGSRSCRKRQRGDQPNMALLRDGIGKISPPKGWRSKLGVEFDESGRGPMWQKGTEMGDMMVETPIKQCPSGIKGLYDFTLLELASLPVHEFRDKADAYRRRQLGPHVSDDDDATMDELARKFWRRLGPTMEESIYGADMEGTLFGPEEEACGWNVDKLETCLNLLSADTTPPEAFLHTTGTGGGRCGGSFGTTLPGVTNSYLYFGMWASVFAAHTEDMNLLSINYLHAGAPKYWYAISPEDKQRFESFATLHFGSAASSCPEFMRHKRYLLSPTVLQKAGISFTTQIQRPGDFVVTFPGSYHFGFNTGFNVAEATNFAVPEWVEWGRKAGVCLCHPHSVRIDMPRFEELLQQYDAYRSRVVEGQVVLSYSEWARAEARAKYQQEIVIDLTNSDDEADEAKNETDPDNVEGTRSLSPQPAEVGDTVRIVSSTMAQKMRLVGGNGAKPNKKKEIFRVAIRGKLCQYTPRTKVLCVLPCEVEDGKKTKKVFAGSIMEIVEGHAKVHFPGMTRKEDVWIRRDSGNIYLDGGRRQMVEDEHQVKMKKRTEAQLS